MSLAAGLDPAGWKCGEGGEIKNGEPQCKEDEKEYALFQIHVCKLLCTYVCTVVTTVSYVCMYVGRQLKASAGEMI
jgi:hypothetical protein